MKNNTQYNLNRLIVTCGGCLSISVSATLAQSNRLESVRAVRVVAAHNEQGGLRAILSQLPTDASTCGRVGTWFEPIGNVTGGASATGARAVSPDGNVVVGWLTTGLGGQGGNPATRAFVWTPCDGLETSIDEVPGISGSSTIAVSTGGQVVVGVGFGACPVGFRQFARDGADVLVDVATGLPTSASSVSADGSVVVGSASDVLGRQAFVHIVGESGVHALGDLMGGASWSDAFAVSANGHAVAGQSQSVQGPEAFIWTAETGMIGLGALPGGTYESVASAISADGHVVVGSSHPAQGKEAFRWSAQSGMVGLGDLSGGARFSEALAVSGNGSIVVGRSATARGDEAFIWTASHGMRRIQDMLAQQLGYDFADWTLTSAHGTSSDGSVIVGTGINPEGHVQGWVAHIPVPHCGADYNNDGASNTLDYFLFLQHFFQGNADFNHDGVTTSQDFFAFFTSFFSGCD